MTKGTSYFGKPLFDVHLASSMLVVAVPLVLIAGMGTLIASPGPILFRS
jgi:lipopolysaccharide/colanic/teichoic acid biosynthesis glycosyltransferase